ncbi:hypothetical protein ACFVYC_04760 [Pseudarthrobacter sp. NPDC058329]|uniref:hypothetical protein n=1 Tax=Pseudarthrobacter sp. NPDC058329 TaxID=3346448 RepID=UPI0036DA0098
MQIGDYLKRQSDWIKAEYLADYDIHDYPAISFEAWQTATKQLKIMNRTRSKPLRWLRPTSPADKFRVLYYPDSGFKQLWVRQNVRTYRSIAIKFLRIHVGVTGAIASSLHADHLVPRSRIKRKYPQGVTVMYFVPGQANITWGASHEKRTMDRALKVRSGITLVSVAKSMGLDGLSQSKNRTYTDIARELINKGICSKLYHDEDFYGPYTQLQRVESELRSAANDPAAQPLKGRPTKVFTSETMLNTAEIKALRIRVPELMEEKLADNLLAKRCAVIDAWVAEHQGVDAKGQLVLPFESVFDLLLSDDYLFPMGQMTMVVKQALTRRGAAAYLMDRAVGIGGADRFAKHCVFQFRDYDWEG